MLVKTNYTAWIKKLKKFTADTVFSLFVGNTTAYIFSAPILLWWGMPQSSLSFIGNAIFTPFLTIFILLCTLILCTSFFGSIPTIIQAPLEVVTQFWMQCLSYGSTKYLYGQQAHPMVLIILVITILLTGFGILKSANKKQLLFVLLAGHITTTITLLIPLTTVSSELSNKFGKLIISQESAAHVSLIDEGYLSGLRSPEKSIPFEVKRHLMRQHGTLKIKNLELIKLNAKTLLAVNELMVTTQITKITLPEISPPQTPFFWRQLAILRKKARNNQTFLKYKKPTKSQNYGYEAQKNQPTPQGLVE